MEKSRNNYIMVGIDPAFRVDGFAACIIDEENTVSFRTFKKFIDVLDFVEELKTIETPIFFAIENSNLQDTNFDRSGKPLVVAKKGRDVGKNMAISDCTVDLMCKYFGEKQVYELSPKAKGKKITKNEVILAIGKGYGHIFDKIKFTQDEKDAYKMAYLGIDNFKKYKKI